MKHWHQYIGLPHVFKADPENGQGADCLIMTWNVLAHDNIPHPALDPEWLDLAERREWEKLKALWLEITKPCNPQQYAITLFEEPTHLGLGIIVDNGLLFAHHTKGVKWLPLRRLINLEYRTFR